MAASSDPTNDVPDDNDSGAREREKTISLLDLAYVFAANRWLIILLTLFGAVFIVAFSIYTLKMPADSPWNPMPNYYQPLTKVQINEQGGSASSLSSMLGDGGSLGNLLLSGTLGGASDSMTLAKELLYSNDLIDAVIEEHDILQRFEEAEFPLTSARNAVKDGLEIGTSGASGSLTGTNILYMAYQDLDPVLATQILTTVLREVEAAFRNLTLERILNKKSFIEERLASVTSDMEIERAKLFEFQKKYGIIDISTQARQQTNIIVGLREDIVRKELEIDTLETYLAKDDPKIVRLRNEIGNIEKLIEDLKSGTEEYTGEFLPQDTIPQLTTEYLSLQREVTVLESIYSMLRQEYEMAKIEEADTSRIFQIIQAPEVPEMKAGPSRGKLCVIFTIAVFFVAVFAAFLREYLRRAKTDPVESQKYEQIKATFRRRRKKRKEENSQAE